MKYLSMLIAVLLLSACGKQTIESLSVTMSLEVGTTVTNGDSFELEISAIDGDVIDFVEIEIPVLNIYEKIDDIDEKKWDFSKTFLIDENASAGTSEITVTVTDSNGIKNTAAADLTIQ